MRPSGFFLLKNFSISFSNMGKAVKFTSLGSSNLSSPCYLSQYQSISNAFCRLNSRDTLLFLGLIYMCSTWSPAHAKAVLKSCSAPNTCQILSEARFSDLIFASPSSVILSILSRIWLLAIGPNELRSAPNESSLGP